MAEEAPALKRDSTMAVTAKVSKIIEKRANGEKWSPAFANNMKDRA